MKNIIKIMALTLGILISVIPGDVKNETTNSSISPTIVNNDSVQTSIPKLLLANESKLIGLGRVVTTGGNLNVRIKPSYSSTIQTKLKNNSYIGIYGKTDNWYFVQYKEGKFGYVYKDYVKLDESSLRYVNTASLNVRTGPSTSYKKIDTLSKGEAVGIISTASSWSYIVYDGVNLGYVHNSYLRINEKDKYPSVSLSVTSYKQFDSRWASKKLGSSSATFKASGCAVTGLSMMESYRTKKDINPYDYSKKLSFTSSGALYWPTTYYTISSSSSSYLTRIYDNLSLSKPVLLGLKNSGNKQHYVVVTGFTGGDTLSTSSFIINDPGSSSRTRLNEVLSIRPLFYKLVTIK